MTESNGKVLTTHPIQAMMSRTGSFPVEVAHRFLESLCDAPSVILDPFCGKGSTLLAARLLGHSAYGIDIAHEAVACSSAKLVAVTLPTFTAYLDDIKLGHPSLARVSDNVHTFFHDSTLRQILSLRNRFEKDRLSESKRLRSHATFALGCLLGILHGHASYSLSISSAHAFSMAPSYVARYANKHGLHPPERNVKECLLAKARVLLKVKLPNVVRGAVRQGCATEMTMVFPRLVGKVDVILTSPPYLDAQTYAKDNWLRLWLLGHDYREIKPEYIETGSTSLFIELMSTVFEQANLMLKDGGIMVCVAGDVRLRNRPAINGSGKPIFRTGEVLSKLAMNHLNGCELLEEGDHVVESTSRYFHSISKSNGHAAKQMVERFFIARKLQK